MDQETSRPLGELEDLVDDLQSRGNLPQEEQEGQAVERDVSVPRELVPLLHRWRERGSNGPQRGDPRTREEVGPGEELPGPHVGVEAALDAEGDARCSDEPHATAAGSST